MQQQLFPESFLEKNPFPSLRLSLDWRSPKRRSPSGISCIWHCIRLVFTLGGGRKSGHWRGWTWKVKKKEKKGFVERPPSDRSLPGNVQIFIYRRESRIWNNYRRGCLSSSIPISPHEKIIMEKATRLEGLDVAIDGVSRLLLPFFSFFLSFFNLLQTWLFYVIFTDGGVSSLTSFALWDR